MLVEGELGRDCLTRYQTTAAKLTQAGNSQTSEPVFDEGLALAVSVDQLLTTGASPRSGFEQGYDRWRKEKKEKGAGIFDISVSQAVGLMLEKIRRGRA